MFGLKWVLLYSEKGLYLFSVLLLRGLSLIPYLLNCSNILCYI